MNKQRLLNVARALRESPNPDKFDMNLIQHPCGTPACALGHYVARTDLQGAFRPSERGVTYSFLNSEGERSMYFSQEVEDHFDLTPRQVEELFSGPVDWEDYDCESEGPFWEGGCGGAKTALEAAEYIERFVNDKS